MRRNAWVGGAAATLAVALVALDAPPLGVSAGAATSSIRLSRITATFVAAQFATHYDVSALDLARRPLTYHWTLHLQLVDKPAAANPGEPGSGAAVDPGCNNDGKLTSSAREFIWRHGDASLGGCDHSKMGPSGHQGLVSLVVSDGVWSCTAIYGGTNTGLGPPPSCQAGKTVKATLLKCRGPSFKLFDNSNGGGVSNGGRPPSFLTRGLSYCVMQLITYHWNNAHGATPGTIGLGGINGSVVGRWRATGSAGQANAPNVNWTANVSTASHPVVINGVYSCLDSDPATWSQDAQTHGTGFCQVYVERAVPVASGPTPTTTTKATKATLPTCKKGKLSLAALPDTGKPPLAVTLAMCSPRSVQWRVDYGDGRSKVGRGTPPRSITHVYSPEGDYRPRLSIITSPNASASPSVATSVSVHYAQLVSLIANPASGPSPLRVSFGLSTTVVNISSWSVDFGDGHHVGGPGTPPPNVAHTYAGDGNYRATFTVKPGAYFADFTVAQIVVGAGTPPILGVRASPTSGAHPLSVRFTIGTTIPGVIASWQLKFGDGYQQSGSGRPPASITHLYAKKGVFAAYLLVAQQQRYGPVEYIVPRNGLVIQVK